MERRLAGQGSAEVAQSPDRVWAALLSPEVLRSLVPGADRVERSGDSYTAHLSYGVGRFRSHYEVRLDLSEVLPPHALDLSGFSRGLLGGGRATAHVDLIPAGPSRTVISWTYEGVVSGPVVLAGTRMLHASANHFVRAFFATFAHHVAADLPPTP